MALIIAGAKRASAHRLGQAHEPRQTRKQVAFELVADLERIYARQRAADKELKELVAATGTSLLGLHGIGPSGAARPLVEVGDLLGDYNAGKMTSLGGHRGSDSDSSATGSQPHTGSSDKPPPGPAKPQRRTRLPTAS